MKFLNFIFLYLYTTPVSRGIHYDMNNLGSNILEHMFIEGAWLKH